MPPLDNMCPQYDYSHPETKEIVTRFQSIDDVHECIIGGVKYDRVWTAPQIAMDTKIDPNNPRQFLDKTAKGGKLGDLWDRAGDLSHERADKNGGVDPLTGKEPIKREKRKKTSDIVIG